MSARVPFAIPRDWQRADCRLQVEALIKSSDLPPGHKRAEYLRWLLATKTPYAPQDLNRVIPPSPVVASASIEAR